MAAEMLGAEAPEGSSMKSSFLLFLMIILVGDRRRAYTISPKSELLMNSPSCQVRGRTVQRSAVCSSLAMYCAFF